MTKIFYRHEIDLEDNSGIDLNDLLERTLVLIICRMNGPNPPHFAQRPSATNIPYQPMTYAQRAMPGMPQGSPTMDRAHSGWVEAATVYTQLVTREVEMDDLIIESSSPLEDEEMIISDEDVPLIDQWLRRIIMEDDNIDLSRAMDSATWTTAPTQEIVSSTKILTG